MSVLAVTNRDKSSIKQMQQNDILDKLFVIICNFLFVIKFENMSALNTFENNY